jgi:hypothetical protein
MHWRGLEETSLARSGFKREGHQSASLEKLKSIKSGEDAGRGKALCLRGATVLVLTRKAVSLCEPFDLTRTTRVSELT